MTKIIFLFERLLYCCGIFVGSLCPSGTYKFILIGTVCFVTKIVSYLVSTNSSGIC